METGFFSYQGDADSIDVENWGAGYLGLSGVAQSLSVLSHSGTIRAFDFPAHTITVDLQNDGDVEVHYRSQEELSIPSGVFGSMTGTGDLSIVHNPLDMNSVQVENTGTGSLILACFEEDAPEQCDTE